MFCKVSWSATGSSLDGDRATGSKIPRWAGLRMSRGTGAADSRVRQATGAHLHLLARRAIPDPRGRFATDLDGRFGEGRRGNRDPSVAMAELPTVVEVGGLRCSLHGR